MSKCLAPLLVAAASIACSQNVVIELSYPSDGARDSVRELEIHVFENASCAIFDPHGAPFLDAPSRANVPAKYAVKARPDDELEDIDNLGAPQYAVVVDGYGPGCLRNRKLESGETVCVENDPSGTRVHRVHGCHELDRGSDSGRTIVLPLLMTAPIGSIITVEELGVVLYNESRPLPVVDGLPAREAFVVQLVNENSENQNGAKVHWRVSKGSGFIVEAQPVISAHGRYDTSNETGREADGLSFGLVHAGATASRDPDPVLTVEAYVPGFESSPWKFSARALPPLDVQLNTVDVDRQTLPLASPDRVRPVLVADLDEDGFMDVVFSSYEGTSCSQIPTHRVGVIYGGPEGVPSHTVYSDRSEGLLYSMVFAKVNDTGRRLLIAFTADPCRETPENTPDGRNYRVKFLSIEAWDPTRESIALKGRIQSETVCTTETNCTTRELEKIAVSADAADLNPEDGLDEIAVSRCSYTAFSRFPIDCYAGIQTHHDGEVTVLRPILTGDQLTGMRVLSTLTAAQTIGGAWQGGGFSEVRFTDLDGNQLPDLAWARPSLVLGVCSANHPDTGYELGDPNRIFQHSANLTFGYSIGVGNFTESPGRDVIVSGGLRAAGPVAGATLLESTGCDFNDDASDIIAGPRSSAESLLVRVASLNGDQWDDAVMLHRAQGVLYTFMGSGTLELARGPTIELGAPSAAALGLGIEGPAESPVVVAATYIARDNRVVIARIRTLR